MHFKKMLPTALLLLLLVACGEQKELAIRSGAGTAPKPAAETAEFWDGGEFAGQQVYSRMWGVSQEAHEAFETCGLDEQDMQALIRHYVQTGSNRMGYVAGAAVGSDAELIRSVFMEVERLTGDVYLLRCERTH
jgi:hypothetical protein